MKIMVTSRRGHHEATVLEPEVSEAIFNKMTGKTAEPLPVEYKTKVPDTFAELAGLWKEGKMGYIPFAGEELVAKFNPEIEGLLFLAPVTGG